MLGYPRLGDAELLLDDRADLACRPFAVREELEDPASNRIAQDVESVHGRTITVSTYISQD